MDLNLNQFTPLVLELVLTGIIVLTFLVLAYVARRLTERYVDTPERQYRVTRYVRRSLFVLGGLLTVLVWSPGLSNLVTIFTVIGAGFAVALREVLLSIAAWIRLSVHPLYQQGDRIQIGDTIGDVVDVRILHTTVMEVGGWVGAEQSSGRLVHLPNGLIFQQSVYNYNEGFNFVWNEYAVTVTFDSDWRTMRRIMKEYAEEGSDDVARRASRELRRLAREYLVHYDVLTPYVYTQITERGIQLTLRYLCEVRKRRGSEHRLAEHLLERLGEHDDIALAPGLRAAMGQQTQVRRRDAPEAPAQRT